jgi:hypothetical protein
MKFICVKPREFHDAMPQISFDYSRSVYYDMIQPKEGVLKVRETKEL